MKPSVDILRPQHRPGTRRGFVLLAVLVFVMLLSMVTVSVALLMVSCAVA